MRPIPRHRPALAHPGFVSAGPAALHPARTAVAWQLWNRVVADDALDAAVTELIDALLVKNHQALRQLKFIINRGVEADLATAQGFEALSAGLTGAVNGRWEVADADRGAGVEAFVTKGELWRRRRASATTLWTEPGPKR